MKVPETYRKKYNRGYVTIDLDAVYSNIESLKANVKKETKFIAVIKTDGYGHGAVPIAKVISEQVEAYGVATLDEAVNLRMHNINKPIFIIGYTHNSQFKRLIENDCRCTIFTEESAKELSDVAVELNKTANIHLKIDTGMSRIGFKDNEKSIEIISRISKMPGINIEGIFTHFYASDESDKEPAKVQYRRFTRFINSLENIGINIPVKHCSNSAAIMDLDEFNMGYVRAGIAMYGLMPSESIINKSIALKPALEWKSHVIFVKEIEAGTGVSYGATFVADKQMKIATVPIGYGDGYSRALSNKGYVLIRGKKAPILGRVCMDQFMVDVTEISEVCIDDEVTLIGKDGEYEITAQELGAMANSFNYEVVCDISKRIPRIYFKDDEVVCTKDCFEDRYAVELSR
ncbi:MAG: alanine racemase [Lachnospiraceae bacterium]|nr:alanine racemase [Lachnospiraceae bacterium]